MLTGVYFIIDNVTVKNSDVGGFLNIRRLVLKVYYSGVYFAYSSNIRKNIQYRKTNLLQCGAYINSDVINTCVFLNIRRRILKIYYTRVYFEYSSIYAKIYSIV